MGRDSSKVPGYLADPKDLTNLWLKLPASTPGDKKRPKIMAIFPGLGGWPSSPGCFIYYACYWRLSPKSLKKKLHSILLQFLWSHKRPRIKFALLARPKEFRGMGLPDFKKYHQVAHLTRLVDWHCYGDSKDWVTLERGLNPPTLHISPWNPGLRHNQLIQLHPITKMTLEVCREVGKLHEVTSSFSPLTSLVDPPPGIQKPPTLPHNNQQTLNCRQVFPWRDTQRLWDSKKISADSIISLFGHFV